MNKFTVVHSQSDPYAAAITGFINAQFPHSAQRAPLELLDALTDEIVGTGKQRLGPKPRIESLAAIREVICHYMDRKLPIPFMVPWGSEKPDGSGVDVAELSALKTLRCLYHRVAEHYEPGLVFNVRLEDASAPHLFQEDAAKARRDAALYTQGFVNLVKVLDLPFINPVPESSLVLEEQFNREADEVLPAMRNYLLSRMGYPAPPGDIRAYGWLGDIEVVTIDHYLGQYAKLYPGLSEEEHLIILARYFAGALARRRLKIRGDAPEWEGKFIDLSFVPSPPGTEGYFGRRVVYRTIPSSITSNHIAPWRAKGYLLHDKDGVRPRLESFHKELPYNPHSVTLSNGETSVAVQMDYVVEE